MNNYKELWKPIRGYESLYKVSNLGNVFSIRRNIILKPIHNGKKYCYVILPKNKYRKQFSIHRLVAIHFIPNVFNKPQVNHIDGDKSNNRVDNLEWCTNDENRKHAIENNLMKVGLGSKKEFDIDGIIYDYINLGYSIDRINKKI